MLELPEDQGFLPSEFKAFVYSSYNKGFLLIKTKNHGVLLRHYIFWETLYVYSERLIVSGFCL